MRKILLATSLVIGATNLVMANEASSDEWEFSATPLFLWGMSIDGDATIGDTTAPLGTRATSTVAPRALAASATSIGTALRPEFEITSTTSPACNGSSCSSCSA